MSKSWPIPAQFPENLQECEHAQGHGLTNSFHTAGLHLTGNSLFANSGAWNRVQSHKECHSHLSALLPWLWMWWAECSSLGQHPTSADTHRSSFSPSPGLLGLSAAAVCPEGEKNPWRCVPWSLTRPHSATPPPLLQPHVLPQSPHGEGHTHPSNNLAPAVLQTPLRFVSLRNWEMWLEAVLLAGLGAVTAQGAVTAVSPNLPRAAGAANICELVGQHFQQPFLPGLETFCWVRAQLLWEPQSKCRQFHFVQLWYLF